MKSIKQLVIVTLALVVFLGTLGLERVFAGPEEIKLKGHLTVLVPSGQSADVARGGVTQTFDGESLQELQAGDVIEVKSGSGVQLRFSDRGLVRLSQNAVVGVDVLDAQHDAYVLNLTRGRLWMNSLYTSARLNVVANGAYVIPDYAAVDVSLDDQKTTVYAHRHQASVGLVPLDFKAQTAKLFPDDEFINSYLLAEGNQTTVYADKIAKNETTLRKLFYSKLVKEFPFGTIDPQVLSTDTWLKENVKLDAVLENKIADDSSQAIRSRGLKISDINNTFGPAVHRFYNFLTFSESKVFDRTNDDIFDHFGDAKYLLLFGQTTKAAERLDLFKKLLDEEVPARGDVYGAVVLQRIRNEYDQMAYVSPDDSLAPAKSAVSNYLLSRLGSGEDEIREKFLLVRSTMNSVYDLADTSSQSARQALEDYFAQFTQIVDQEKTRLGRMRNILAEENQIMDNLIRNYPIFYRDRFFAMKSQLEQQWLALLPDGEGKNEEKQTIVSTKIDFLRQLKTYFLADKIAVDDAKQIVFRLFREADDLQLPPDQQVAVNELYAKRLEDFGVFFRYLNSPEYVGTTLHGASRKNQFQEFVQAQEEQISIDEVRQEILGNQTAPVVTTDQILSQIQKDFAAIGATSVSLGTLRDISQRSISVSNVAVAGVSVRGQYDWNNKLLSEIYAGNALLSTEPVKLSNLELLVKTKTQQPKPQPAVQPEPEPSPTPVPVPTVSKTERVAKILLIQKLKAGDIGTTEADLVINDLSKSFFTVGNAILVSDQSISFSFDVDGKNSIVTNLVVHTAAGDKPGEGSLNLADVSAQVKAAFEAGKPQS